MIIDDSYSKVLVRYRIIRRTDEVFQIFLCVFGTITMISQDPEQMLKLVPKSMASCC